VAIEAMPGRGASGDDGAQPPDPGGDVAGDGRMPLMEHLTELRSRLIKALIAVAVGMLIGFIAYEWIFDFLLDPYLEIADPGQAGLYVQDPLEGFSVRLKVSAYAGVALAMPVLLWQLWRFVSPGLYSHERRYAIPFVVSALALFLLGAGLAYYTLPRALDFLSNIGGENLIEIYSPNKYFQLITYMMLAFGIGFEFPILLLFLQLAGILTPDTLARYRRYALIGIVVLVAVITPSGDPISLLMLSVPMYLFYEASILIGRVLTKKRRAAAADTGP
jgi:sec-independent protein translocase protein TatC